MTVTAGDHDLSAGSSALAEVESAAGLVLGHYAVGAGTRAVLHHVSENATFLVHDPGGETTVLRAHRLGYHSLRSVESELAWMSALRSEAGIRTPRVLPARDGRLVVSAPGPRSGQVRLWARFELLAGTEPAGDRPAEYARIGALAARMHRHARAWPRPAGFTRFRWDADAAFGPAGSNRPGRWGRWREGVGVGPAEAAVLRPLEATLRRRLRAFGAGPSRFGLAHADLRAANLLVTPGEPGSIGVIDFDDCGLAWHLYDLGTSFSFFEDRPDVPELAAAWLEGYRTVAPLPAEDEAEAWTFILLRRMLLLAWLGTHRAAAAAQDLGAEYAQGTCALAESYLRTHA